MLTSFADDDALMDAVMAGAAGYVLKNSNAAELELAIRAVIQGENYLTPAVAKFIAGDYAASGSREAKSDAHLTPRQIEILKLIAQGYTRKQIAQKLHISVKTFDTHRAQLMEQLAIRDAAGLVSYATRMGLLRLDE